MMMRTGKDEKTLQDFKDQHQSKMSRRIQDDTLDLTVEGGRATPDGAETAVSAKGSGRKRKVFHARSRSAVADPATRQTEQQRREELRDKFLGI